MYMNYNLNMEKITQGLKDELNIIQLLDRLSVDEIIKEKNVIFETIPDCDLLQALKYMVMRCKASILSDYNLFEKCLNHEDPFVCIYFFQTAEKNFMKEQLLAFSKACEKGNMDMVMLFITNKIYTELELYVMSPQTLFKACDRAHLGIVKYLIECGPDKFTYTQYIQALQYVSREYQSDRIKETKKFLISICPKIQSQEKKGWLD